MNKKTSFLLSTLNFILLTSVAGAAAFERDLTVGSRGSDVETLQNFLTQQGVYSGPITAYFGNLTRDGVKNFQDANSITPAVGYFGPKTRFAANQKSAYSASPPPYSAPSPSLTIEDLQRQIEILLAELQKLQTASSSVPAPTAQSPMASTTPAPQSPIPVQFSGSVKFFSIYPNVTLSSYVDVPLNEFQLSDSSDKVAITKLRLTNTGTLSDVYFNEIQLVNSSNNEVLASLNAPVDKVAEFVLTPNSSKKDSGLMLSGGVYAIKASLKTFTSGSERKPNIKLDILSAGDITAVDFETLSKPADISGNSFPIEGPYITTF